MKYIIGIDEVGYGAWAGPLYVCGVKAPANWTMEGLNDSKKLSREQRLRLFDKLNESMWSNEISFIIRWPTNTHIDKNGLGVCHKECFTHIIKELAQPDNQIILDGNLNPRHLDKYGIDTSKLLIKSVVKADTKFPTVMAASIIAKHTRDTEMQALHAQYPEYGWNQNVGYIVPAHLDAVRKYGLTKFHRKSYNVKL